MRLSRRGTLLGLAATALGGARLALADAPTQNRLVVILLRGALDGLATAIPYGDANLATLRGELVPPPIGAPNGMLDLGGFYGLHPALTACHALYQQNQLLILHAIAGPTRSRSHFDAQDCLESGADRRMDSGWLNRALAALHGPAPSGGLAISAGLSAPLILRGPAKVGAVAPPAFGHPPPGLYAALAALNHTDPVIGPAIEEGLRERGFASSVTGGVTQGGGFPALARMAGQLLAAEGGPRVAALEAEGWDTHVGQVQRLTQALRTLDEGIDALRQGLGPAWSRTAVLVVTEFGRTAHVNGTHGTDHGTATIALLAGGAISGGRVQATWPGLGQGQLHENRDLAPTADMRAAAMALLIHHLGVPPGAMPGVFPGSAGITPAPALLKA